MLSCLYCHWQSTYDLGLAKLLRRLLNVWIFEKHMSHHSNIFIIYYGNTKHPGVHPGFTKVFFTIANIQTTTWSTESNVDCQSNM